MIHRPHLRAPLVRLQSLWPLVGRLAAQQRPRRHLDRSHPKSPLPQLRQGPALRPGPHQTALRKARWPMPLDASVMAAVDTSQQATGNVGTASPTPSGSRPGPRWFVVSTYPQAERRALDHLQQQGYQAYLPLCIIRRRYCVLRLPVPPRRGAALPVLRVRELRSPARPVATHRQHPRRLRPAPSP